MSKTKKLYAKIKNKPKSITFEEIDKLLLSGGFIKRQGKGSHVTYSHPDLKAIEDYISIPYKKPYIKEFYVKKALELYDRVNGC